MMESLESVIKADALHPAHSTTTPIFVDSEDLQDLDDLLSHVTNSNSVVLLLTPGVLLRPWCLLELVTAIQHGIKIVPVEVQRPGIQYAYPDENFYRDIACGGVLDQDSFDFLEDQDIDKDLLIDSLRQVFRKIACPYSPHKSNNIRQAEIVDILKRCAKKSAVGSIGSSSMGTVPSDRLSQTRLSSSLSGLGSQLPYCSSSSLGPSSLAPQGSRIAESHGENEEDSNASANESTSSEGYSAPSIDIVPGAVQGDENTVNTSFCDSAHFTTLLASASLDLE